MRTVIRLLFASLLLAGCTDEPSQDELTKDEARARGGKSDLGYDYCEMYEWYGDGVCDEFCVHPDPDCGEARPCGGFAGFTCDAGFYCDYAPEASCGAADQMGTCKPTPAMSECALAGNRVCGCDGQTYVGSCAAHASGASVAYDGPCEEAAPRTCGGFAGLTCDAGSFCDYELATQCGAGDQTGTCKPIPATSDCPLAGNWVCGCNGQDYLGTCFANAAGTAVAHTGRCQ